MASEQPESSPEPQLAMVRSSLDPLPEMPEMSPYRLRTYQTGDEAAWAEIMNTGIGAGWTAERCRTFLTLQPAFRPSGLFFAVRDSSSGEEVVGTACAWTKAPDERETGIVHMVCVHPRHRGHRLGYALVWATLRDFRDRGFRRATLTTDDFRLSAIRAYLDLGFVPEMIHPSHPLRWQAVMRALAERPRPAPER